MSKSKRKQMVREERQRAKNKFYDWASGLMEDARDFMETATPFEISTELSKIGVSTSHREGVDKLLDQAIDQLVRYELSPEQIVQGFLTYLLDRWKSELRDKGRECGNEDFVFLVEAARFYAMPWVKKNRIQQELEQAKAISAQPGLTSELRAESVNSNACVKKHLSQS